MRPPDKVRKDFVRQWLRKAGADLETAKHLVQTRPDLCSSAAFHAQQAAEKVLRAALVWHQVEFPKTHDVDRLIALMGQADAKLRQRLAGGTARSGPTASMLDSRATYRNRMRRRQRQRSR
jgi:hypothetical protein